MPMAGNVTAQPTAAARLGTSLGWFSLAAGAASLLMPGPVARAAGLLSNPRTLRAMRAMGLRELASGAGILLRPQRPGWLWMRVAGDAIDLALLGLSGRRRPVANSDAGSTALAGARYASSRQRLLFASAALAGVTVLDMLAAYEQGRLQRLGLRYGPSSRSELDATGALRIRKSIAINQSPEACYRFWRDFENFPRFMKHVEEVRARLQQPRDRLVVSLLAYAGLRPGEVCALKRDQLAAVASAGEQVLPSTNDGLSLRDPAAAGGAGAHDLPPIYSCE